MASTNSMIASEIPLISLKNVDTGDSAAIDAVAGQLRSALTDIGFFMLVDHGVDWSLTREAYGQAKRFFDLPMSRKLEVALGSGKADANAYLLEKKGYICYDGVSEHADDFDTRNKNGVESLFLDYEHKDQNQWPAGLEGFRDAVLDYMNAVNELAFRLLPLIARSLDLPPDFFANAFEAPVVSLRLSHNPPARPEEDIGDRWGFLAHTDSNLLTLLPANEVGGLEIKPFEKDWASAPYVPESFVVNSGDILRLWSNNIYLSTPHRVLKPRVHRYSMPFFLSPTSSFIIEPVPTRVSAERPPLNPRLTVEQILRKTILRRDFEYQQDGVDFTKS